MVMTALDFRGLEGVCMVGRGHGLSHTRGYKSQGVSVSACFSIYVLAFLAILAHLFVLHLLGSSGK